MLICETVNLGDVDERVHADVARHRRHGHGRLQVRGGHRHAEVHSPTATDHAMDVGWFQQVFDDDLGACGPQGRRPVVLTPDHCANGKPTLEKQPGDGSPDGPDLTGCPGDENRYPLFAMHFPTRSGRRSSAPGPARPLLTLESGDQCGVDHVFALRNASGVMKSRADVRLQSMLADDPCERSSLVVTDGRGSSGHRGNKFVGSEPWLAEASQHRVELSSISYPCARHATS
jgi:hypothetical protein